MVVTLFRGHPSNELLPKKEILQAVTAVLSESRPTENDDETRHPLTYGSDPGALEVREAFAKWVNEKSNNEFAPATADCINLTNGASFGAFTALLQCCPREYTKLAFAVSPTYYLINQIFADAGFKGRQRAVVETDEGIDLSELEAMLHEIDHSDPLKFRYVMYLVPTFSNPGGYSLTREDCERLLRIARKYNVLLLCDHVYDYLEYQPQGEHVPTLVTLDRESLPLGSFGNVIANYSFSKYLGPGLRVGWQECATPELAYHLSQSGYNKSGGTPAHLNTFIAKEIVATGEIEVILANLNRVYGQRSSAYLHAMKEYLPAGTKIRGGNGGYFFWLELPPIYDIQAITAECKTRGVILAPGQHFEVAGDEKGWGSRCFRVSLSYHAADDAVEAIRIWGDACRRHQLDLAKPHEAD